MALTIPDSVRELLTSPALAHLATVSKDGSPHVSVAWVGLEGNDIVIGTLHDQKKLRNIRRDPRVTLSIATDRTNPIGMAEYLVAYGRASVEEGGAPELLQRLAETYVGPGVKFPPMDDPPTGYVTRISVERFGGIGPWAG